jgi:hypothetical protein
VNQKVNAAQYETQNGGNVPRVRYIAHGSSLVVDNLRGQAQAANVANDFHHSDLNRHGSGGKRSKWGIVVAGLLLRDASLRWKAGTYSILVPLSTLPRPTSPLKRHTGSIVMSRSRNSHRLDYDGVLYHWPFSLMLIVEQ